MQHIRKKCLVNFHDLPRVKSAEGRYIITGKNAAGVSYYIVKDSALDMRETLESLLSRFRSSIYFFNGAVKIARGDK